MAAQAKAMFLLLAACCLPAFSQAYAYDAFNRLESVVEGSAWTRSYYYDRYGNRAMQGDTPTPAIAPLCALSTDPTCDSSTTAKTPAYTASNNRLTSAWADYDTAGNMLAFKDPIGSGTRDWSAFYDAENKQRFYCGGTTSACDSSNADAEYVYDGEGNRVQKLTTGETTTYVYDAFGRLAAEYSTAGPSGTAGSYFRTTDHLGSTRLVTDGSGAVYDRRDFFPFGEKILASSTYSDRDDVTGYNNANPASAHLFTAKERDQESGLDYFLARYLGSSQGRFTSPDPVGGSKANPQSLNLYAYVLNNPLAYVDPTGLVVEWHDSKAKCKDGETECLTSAQRKFENRLEKLRNSDDEDTRAKGEKLTETYGRLKSSKAVFEVVKGGSSGSSRGEISYSGNDHFTIELTGGRDVMGLSSTQKLAHEFEHGRQILDGELSFQNYTGAWLPFGHDLNDEAKGFEATFAIESATPGNGRILNGFQDVLRRRGVAGLAEHLGRASSYQNVPLGPTNVSPNMPPAIYKPPR